MESVLLSTPPSYLVAKAGQGKTWAGEFLKLRQNIDKPLSAILSLNTVAHTIGAAGVGAQAVKVFGQAYFGVVSAVLTILILVITEIIPKTIGANYARNLAKVSNVVINSMIIITYPLVVMSQFITRMISKKDNGQSVSREEISAMANIGANEGLFTDKEHRIIQNVLKLKNVRVNEIMTPRVVAAIANEQSTLAEFFSNKEYLRFSRIPVYTDNDEDITGYVFRQDIFEKLAEDKHLLHLVELKRDILVMPNTSDLLTTWEKLLSNKEHIALIVDEYGGMDGIVTLEDIFETLLGLEITDETDVVTDMQDYARKRWNKKQHQYKLLERIKL